MSDVLEVLPAELRSRARDASSRHRAYTGAARSVRGLAPPVGSCGLVCEPATTVIRVVVDDLADTLALVADAWERTSDALLACGRDLADADEGVALAFDALGPR